MLYGFALASAVVVGGCGSADGPPGGRVTVAVAANFLEAHESLVDLFTRRTGVGVVTSAGSTGQLYAQIVNGAPYDVFLAADSQRPRLLQEAGLAVRGSGYAYATGRLALYGPTMDSVRAGGADLESDEIRNIAIANPRTAPYGAAAMEVLAGLGIEGLDDRLVRGESIGQAYQFVESGAAEIGFVALSQVAGSRLATIWRVPEELHTPIVQEAVLLTRAEENEAAARFIEFLRSPEARAIIESFGYAAGTTAGAP